MVQVEEFPVVLYNGERQINVGNIEIDPTIDFHKFRTMLKQMIGISYNNLTTYLVESRRPEHIQSEGRKILITSKVDFLVLVREKNAYFLVVMKRSRRERRRKNYNRSSVDLTPADLFDYHFNHHHQITTQVPECGKAEIWLQELQMQRANKIQLMLHDMNASFPSITEAYPGVERFVSRPLCEDCIEADRWGLKPEFHLCVYDEVVEGFLRSPAGPIARPQ
ncbi:hypothetical protein L1987_81742 [Smallanthus sonchifolius]|uniref:Uncharacterized protein n=1 Tax=Smallanthus sonchifolius TaxID=185202 RepID=A0ACB8YS05_9ASTR|nr:hypothetical protein L1987_81742 [Smallanthus sonchifolius]